VIIGSGCAGWTAALDAERFLAAKEVELNLVAA
jgi:hypothetical protein